MTALAALFGIGVGAGLWLMVRAWTTPRTTQRIRPRERLDRVLGVRIVVAVFVGALVGAATGWVIGAVLTALAVYTLPRVIGPDREQATRIARFEAIAAWAEMLRDTLSAAAGLEQAILVTAPLVPDQIRDPITSASARLRSGERLAPTLRHLADDLNDPTADLVISALVLAAERRASNLGALLGSLAEAARDHAALRMSIAAGRAQARSEVRITIGTTLVFAAGLLVFDRHYLAPYDGAEGQFVLLLVGGLFALGFWALARIARVPEPDRLLTLTHIDASDADHRHVRAGAS